MSARHVDFAVIGLGYVGLPLAQAAAGAGLQGVGLDSSRELVELINRGVSHVDDVSDREVAALLASGFRATSDSAELRAADVVVICVPTPLATEGGPDLTAVIAAARAVSDNLTPKTLVVLESTTWPGTTEEVLRPILEESGLRAGVDFDLAFSPERIDPGNPTYSITNTPKVVGGLDARSTARAAAFYGRFVERIVPAAGTREAEMSKLLENTYRQVNIALVNEMAKFSHELGIDFWDVIRCASTKPFGFQPFHPGPGVGGHCIPIDPNYLSHQVRERLGYPFRFVELAQEVNRSMPSYVASRSYDLLARDGIAVRGAKVLLLGVTYKAGISDQRESPALPLARELLTAGADLAFYDPFVDRWDVDGTVLHRVADLQEMLERSHLAIHLQPHPDYDGRILHTAGTRVLDTRGIMDGENIQRL